MNAAPDSQIGIGEIHRSTQAFRVQTLEPLAKLGFEMPRACPVVLTIGATESKVVVEDATGLPGGASRLSALFRGEVTVLEQQRETPPGKPVASHHTCQPYLAASVNYHGTSPWHLETEFCKRLFSLCGSARSKLKFEPYTPVANICILWSALTCQRFLESE